MWSYRGSYIISFINDNLLLNKEEWRKYKFYLHNGGYTVCDKSCSFPFKNGSGSRMNMSPM